MNFRKLILFFIIFVSLSYYYYHHELENRSIEKKQTITQKKVLHLETGVELDYLSIQNPRGSFTLTRQHDNTWMITDPIVFPADHVKVQSIVSTITIDAKVRDFGDTVFDLPAIGLSDDAQRIGIGYQDVKKYLLLGDETHIGSNRYARWEDSDSVFVVRHDFWSVLQKDLMSVRKRAILTVDMNTLSRISIDLPEYAAQFETVEDSGTIEWWITEPVYNRVRAEVFISAVREISNLLVNDFYDDASLDDPHYGLTDSSFGISVHHNGSEQTIVIGNKTDDQKYYYAIYPDYDIVITIAADVIENLKIAPEKLIDTRILLLTPDDVRSFTYRKGSRVETFELENAQWQWVSENESARDVPDLNHSIYGFLSALAASSYSEILSAEHDVRGAINDDLILFALEILSPNQSLAVRFYEVNDIFVLTVGRDPNYYVINAETYDAINESLKKFL
jgi:hypothetical protein